MKGLLLKDMFTLVKQARTFLLFIVIFSLIPGYNTMSFAICFAALLPLTAQAYDERCKWDQLAAMMPYSTTQLVISKYLLGLICILASMAIGALASFVQTYFSSGAGLGVDYMSSLAGALAAGLLLEEFMLPVIFRFGTEKGRMAMMAGVVVIMVGIGALTAIDVGNALAGINIVVAGGAACAVIIILYFASMALSVKLYKQRTAA